MGRMGVAMDFEPYSVEILKRMNSLKTTCERNALFEFVYNHPKMTSVGGTQGLVKVSCDHKTSGYWKQTIEMARLLALQKIPTAFLSEEDSETSADAISKINGHWYIVDFKYCISTNWNTIQGNLTKAFYQSQCAIIQFINADAGQFKKAVEYMRRNQLLLKDIVAMNKYGRFIVLSFKDLKNGKYINKIKGFL